MVWKEKMVLYHMIIKDINFQTPVTTLHCSGHKVLKGNNKDNLEQGLSLSKGRIEHSIV